MRIVAPDANSARLVLEYEHPRSALCLNERGMNHENNQNRAHTLAACDRGTTDPPAHGSARVETARISDMRTSHAASRLMFQYRTQSSRADCKAEAAEMPKVWDQLMTPYARNSNVQSVALMPEDPSGVSIIRVQEEHVRSMGQRRRPVRSPFLLVEAV